MLVNGAIVEAGPFDGGLIQLQIEITRPATSTAKSKHRKSGEGDFREQAIGSNIAKKTKLESINIEGIVYIRF